MKKSSNGSGCREIEPSKITPGFCEGVNKIERSNLGEFYSVGRSVLFQEFQMMDLCPGGDV